MDKIGIPEHKGTHRLNLHTKELHDDECRYAPKDLYAGPSVELKAKTDEEAMKAARLIVQTLQPNAKLEPDWCGHCRPEESSR